MSKLTAIILTKNEEKNIAQCLKSLSFADEIIVIDDYSTDKTREIAQKYGARVYRRKLDDFASQRNYGLSKAKGEWVLFVDADERVNSELREEILKAIKDQKISGCRIPRKNKIFGRFFRFTDWYPDYQLHLFRGNKGRYIRKVHEQVEIEGKIKKLRNTLTHFNYQTIDQFLKKNYFHYADLEAEALIEAGYKFKWQDLLKKPFAEFLRRFFAARGYKDGIHGLAVSILVSFATFVVYAKVWEKQGFKEGGLSVEQLEKEFLEIGGETKHWLRERKIKEEKNFLRKAFLKLFK